MPSPPLFNVHLEDPDSNSNSLINIVIYAVTGLLRLQMLPKKTRKKWTHVFCHTFPLHPNSKRNIFSPRHALFAVFEMLPPGQCCYPLFSTFFFYFKRLLNRKCCSLSLSVALVRSVCYCLFLNTSTGLSFFAVDPWGYSVFIRLTAHMLSTLCITYTWNWKRKSFIQSYLPDPFPFLTNLFFHWLYLA